MGGEAKLNVTSIRHNYKKPMKKHICLYYKIVMVLK